MTENIEVFTQSSIKITDGENHIYIDPLGIKEEFCDADYILITHDHYDHFSPEDIKKIAERYARVVFQANSVLVPTKLRRTGRVHVTRVPMHISTNFVVFTYGTANEANIIGSYMSTIFYQLECEVQSKDHAGLRKLELQDVQTTHVPIVSALTTAEIARVNAELPNIQFLDLNNPVIRNIDLIWADILYGTNANAVLNDAIRLLRFLANRRNP